MDILERLFALDREMTITKEMCLELVNLIDEIHTLEGFDTSRLDGDMLYCSNQLECVTDDLFLRTLDESIRTLSQFVHPVWF